MKKRTVRVEIIIADSSSIFRAEFSERKSLLKKEKEKNSSERRAIRNKREPRPIRESALILTESEKWKTRTDRHAFSNRAINVQSRVNIDLIQS